MVGGITVVFDDGTERRPFLRNWARIGATQPTKRSVVSTVLTHDVAAHIRPEHGREAIPRIDRDEHEREIDDFLFGKLLRELLSGRFVSL